MRKEISAGYGKTHSGPQQTSAAKAATDFAALTARLEAAPFQNAGHRIF